jgi:hypothetical protein
VHSQDSMSSPRETKFALISAVITFAASLRALPILGTAFPLNDGGMFLTMAGEIAASGVALPSVTSYNDAGIPFAYPPLGLYLLAALGAPGAAAIDALRFVPLLLSVATIPVVYLIGRGVLGSPMSALLATAFFALSTGSYQFLIMGGGVTRALGFLMAVVTVYFATRMYREGGRWTAWAAGAALGATALSHPQAAVFGAVSVPLVLPFVATDRHRALRRLFVTGVVAAAVTLPWLALVISEHGIDPLLSAASTGGGAFLGVVSLASSRTSGGVIDVIGIATTFGFVICVVRRFWLPPIWILAIAIVDSRAGQPYLSVPAGLAIAFMLRDIERMVRRSMAGGSSFGMVSHLPAALAVIVIAAAFFDSLASQSLPETPLRSLSSETRSAMAWVRTETEPGSRFVVLSGRYWAVDAEAEWFPALANRRSIATVQGSEWQGRYVELVERATELPRCVVENDRDCIVEWFTVAGEVDYLFLVDTPSRELGGVVCCHQLADQLSPIYDTDVVHREGPVLIVRLTPPSS